MKHVRNNKGFSYVEMIVVIGIMSLMTAFIALTLGTVNRNNVRRAAESIESKFNEARIGAMSKGTTNGYLIIAKYKSNIYTYIGEYIDASTGDPYTAEAISKRGDKLCSANLEVMVDGHKFSENGDVLYIQFKQSTGGVNAYTGADPTSAKSQFIVTVANQKNTMVSSFRVYKSTGKIKSE